MPLEELFLITVGILAKQKPLAHFEQLNTTKSTSTLLRADASLRMKLNSPERTKK